MLVSNRKQKETRDFTDLPTIEQLEQELEHEKYRTTYRKTFRSTLYSLLVVAAAAALVAILVLPVLQISGTSMAETLNDGDVLVALNGSDYETGDIIAFYFNNKVLVKRVIATAGQWVDIAEDGTVSINGEELEEPYLTEKAFGECNITLPYQVPDGRIFVMGDHRATSEDSRNTAVGCIDQRDTIGRIVFRLWPLDGLGFIG